MKLFSGRMRELEVMNRILTDSAQQRVERVEQLERVLQQIKPELMGLPQRARELEEDNRQLTERLHLLTKRLHELEQEVVTARTLAALLKRVTQLGENNGRLTDAIAHCKSCIEQLEKLRCGSSCGPVRQGGQGH